MKNKKIINWLIVAVAVIIGSIVGNILTDNPLKITSVGMLAGCITFLIGNKLDEIKKEHKDI